MSEDFVQEEVSNEIAISEEETKVETTKEFEDAVSEYKVEERKVVKGFIQGMVRLGKILSDKRTFWKEQREWLKYLEAINVSASGANKMINIFSYAEQNLALLEMANVDNWQKVGVFLALPDELKAMLADEIDGEQKETKEFILEAQKLREGNVDVPHIKEDPIPEDMGNLLAEAIFEDIPLLAEKLIERLQEQGIDVTKASLPAATAFLTLTKINKDVEDGGFDGMAKPEAKFWVNKIRSMAREMTKIRY